MTFQKHKCGRPPNDAVEVLALRHDGRWIKDDGKKHRAFSYRNSSGWPYAIAMECDCVFSGGCAMRTASRKTCERFGASNGDVFA